MKIYIWYWLALELHELWPLKKLQKGSLKLRSPVLSTKARVAQRSAIGKRNSRWCRARGRRYGRVAHRVFCEGPRRRRRWRFPGEDEGHELELKRSQGGTKKQRKKGFIRYKRSHNNYGVLSLWTNKNSWFVSHHWVFLKLPIKEVPHKT